MELTWVQLPKRQTREHSSYRVFVTTPCVKEVGAGDELHALHSWERPHVSMAGRSPRPPLWGLPTESAWELSGPPWASCPPLIQEAKKEKLRGLGKPHAEYSLPNGYETSVGVALTRQQVHWFV